MGEAQRHLALVGLMGSGKSTIGRRLADELGRPFVDADDVVVERAGRPIAAIFAADGEAEFRRIEAAVLADLLGGDEPHVIATGGGAVLDAATCAVLAERAEVVWLRGSPRTLALRLGDDATRPLLGDDPEAALERLEGQRRERYEAVADVVVDVDDLDAAATVDRIVAAAVP